MAIRMTKPWMSADEALSRLHGHLGVFQLADADGNVLFIGFAGGRDIYGLKGVVADALASHPEATQVRYELTTSYHTRYRELLMVHVADHGELPMEIPPIRLGKLSPA